MIAPFRPVSVPLRANKSLQSGLKLAGVRGQAPLGAKISGSGSCLFSGREKYCHKGAWPSPLSVEIGGGSPPFAPISVPSRSDNSLQSCMKACWGCGVHALWGQRWTRLPARSVLLRTREVLPQRGHRRRPPSRRRLAWGVHDGDHGPFRRSPENGWFAGEKSAGSGVRALWGPPWTRLPFFAAMTSTAITGHGLRPPSRRRLALGVQHSDHGPLRRSPENRLFAGEKQQGPGSMPFGGSNGPVWLFLLVGRSTATTGARPFADRLRDDDGAPSAPSRTPRTA
jgi:hypothetical protein